MIKIVCVGKMKDKALVSLTSEYTKRISPFSKVEILEVKDESNAHAEREAESERIKDLEAERVLAKLRGTDLVVLLDLHGRMWNSEDFARRLGDWQQKSGQNSSPNPQDRGIIQNRPVARKSKGRLAAKTTSGQRRRRNRPALSLGRD